MEAPFMHKIVIRACGHQQAIHEHDLLADGEPIAHLYQQTACSDCAPAIDWEGGIIYEAENPGGFINTRLVIAADRRQREWESIRDEWNSYYMSTRGI